MTRCPSLRLTPDPRRVIAKPFIPREEIFTDGSTRLQTALGRIVEMPDADVERTLDAARALFDGRHRDLDVVFRRSLDALAPHLERLDAASAERAMSAPGRRDLIAAYFTHEYSIEAAALGNPSMVAAPDQTGLAAGELRFVMSLRSIGEGHISSIEFRTGVVGADAAVRLEPPSRWATTGTRQPHDLDRTLFARKLNDLGVNNEVTARTLAMLGERFTVADLEVAVERLGRDGVERSISGETTRLMHWLASSNYVVSFPPSVEISERVLFPNGPTESHGMEDARFVRFVDDHGSVRYVATYTAFDGHQILPQLLETDDFTEFRVTTLGGATARNKGIAIFPRMIDGRYVALGRHDNVNNFIMTSDEIRFWDNATRIQEPERPWELMQLGNCGSPLETEAGWLVITHGVGPFRRYTLGALLLDLHDPTQVIGHLEEPLLSPDPDEREGYVPNVVYSCGGLLHADHLILPYGFADVGAGVATTPLGPLLERLVR